MKLSPFRSLVLAGLVAIVGGAGLRAADSIPGVRKVRDLVIYQDDKFHCAFPSVIQRPDGEIWVAFRRAPNRKAFGEEKNYHVDPNSYLVMVRSRDAVTWGPQPELIYANPLGGSQDPGLLQLRDGTVLCTSYSWSFVRPDGVAHLQPPFLQNYSGSIFGGGYFVRTDDGGKSWQGPFHPPHIAPEILRDAYGQPVPPYNRGAMIEGHDGRIFWVVAAAESVKPHKSSTHLLISEDKGKTWKYSCPVAGGTTTFNETSIYETPKGDLVAFLRSEDFNDQACIARSTNGGRSFQKWQGMGFQGHPLHALRLPDNRVLLTYGYRHAPLGIRARILNAECTDFATAPEMVLRDDGGTTDLGYPWSVQLDPTHVLVTYYFDVGAGIQHIAGTILEIK
jgi:sialidase-1